MKENWQRAFATIVTLAAIQTPVLDARENTVAGAPSAGVAPPTALAADPNSPRTRAPLAERYGLPGTAQPGTAYVPEGLPGYPAPGGRLEAKLREIVLDEVKLDGLPLSEVLNFLNDESRKRDPEKKGINFLLNPNPPQSQPATITTVDPATGLPIGETANNLKAAIAGETHEYTDMYPGMAKQAREEGFAEIADWFETLAKAERSHANRFQKALDGL